VSDLKSAGNVAVVVSRCDVDDLLCSWLTAVDDGSA